MFRAGDSSPGSGPSQSLTITVKPAKSAWYPGETFRARITFSNPAQPVWQPHAASSNKGSRPSVDLRRVPRSLSSPAVESASTHDYPLRASRRRRERLHQIGTGEDEVADGDTRSEIYATRISAVANNPEWRKEHPRSRSRSIDDHGSEVRDANGPQGLTGKPTLNGKTRRSLPASIPLSHSHARRISMEQSGSATVDNAPITSPIDSEHAYQGQRSPINGAHRAGLRANGAGLISIVEDDSSGAAGVGGDMVNPASTSSVHAVLPPVIPELYDGYTPAERASRKRLDHARAPSYMSNYSAVPTSAEGAASLEPGTCSTPPVNGDQFRPVSGETRTRSSARSTMIIWAHARLRGRFVPSSTYIPPDPLLPLRTTLLHQPLGSGGFSSTSQLPPSSSGWITFGSGTIGQEQTPSLTGSLLGLAKGLVSTGIGVGAQAGGGTLEEERKRIWNSKDLPVLETMRTLVDVNEVVHEGEVVSYDYEVALPSRMPPTFRGRALRFAYEVCVSVNIGLDASGRKQRSEDVMVPIKILPMDAGHDTYDILRPIIMATETGLITKVGLESELGAINGSPRKAQEDLGDVGERVESFEQLKVWAKGLLLVTGASKVVGSELGPLGAKLLRGHIAASHRDDVRVQEGAGHPSGATSSMSSEKAETRASSKIFFEIFRHGVQLATVRLARPEVSVGEHIGVFVQINRAEWPLHVSKLSATLMTDERIPYHLLPPSASSSELVHPNLRKIVAEHHSSLTIDTVELAFDLSVSPDSTPAFTVGASPCDANSPQPDQVEKRKHSQRSIGRNMGGLRWLIELRFGTLSARDKPSLLPTDLGLGDRDNMYQAAPGLLVTGNSNEADEGYGSRFGAEYLDVVTCEIPIAVCPGKVRGMGNVNTFVM